MGKARRSAGELIAVRLAELGLSQVAFARTVGVSEGAVSRWIANKRTPSAPMAARIARALHVPPSELVRWFDDDLDSAA